MKNKKIFFIVTIILILFLIPVVVFGTKKIREKNNEGKTIVYVGEDVSDITEPTDVVLKIPPEKDTSKRDFLIEKWSYLKEDNNGYERKMTEEQFEEFIDFVYEINETNEKSGSTDFSSIQEYIEKVCGEPIKKTDVEVSNEYNDQEKIEQEKRERINKAYSDVIFNETGKILDEKNNNQEVSAAYNKFLLEKNSEDITSISDTKRKVLEYVYNCYKKEELTEVEKAVLFRFLFGTTMNNISQNTQLIKEDILFKNIWDVLSNDNKNFEIDSIINNNKDFFYPVKE